MKHKLLAYGFVMIQFGLLIAIALLPGEPIFFVLQITGLIAMVIGLVISSLAIWQLRKHSLTALPTPVKNADLLTSGLYQFVRHPIYTGLIMFMSGVVLGRYSTIRILLLACLIFLLYRKSIFEEEQLTELFGKKYTKYQAKTGRFIPNL